MLFCARRIPESLFGRHKNKKMTLTGAEVTPFAILENIRQWSRAQCYFAKRGTGYRRGRLRRPQLNEGKKQQQTNGRHPKKQNIRRKGAVVLPELRLLRRPCGLTANGRFARCASALRGTDPPSHSGCHPRPQALFPTPPPGGWGREKSLGTRMSGCVPTRQDLCQEVDLTTLHSVFFLWRNLPSC